MSIPKILNKYYQRYIPDDLRRIKTDLSNAATFGWKAGKRCAKINNKNLATDMYSRGKSIVKNLDIPKEDLMPAVGIVLGTIFIPMLGGSVIGYFMGRGAKKITKILSKIARF